MAPFYVDHLRKHALAIKYLPPANKKASAHQLCQKLAAQLTPANEANYVRASRPGV